MFSALFAIMNPIANVPVFLSPTRGASDAERRKVAVTARMAVSIGCVVAAVAGSSMLGVFGASIDDFRLAGGLLVLLIALAMLRGSANTQQAPADKERKVLADADSVAIHPLAVPLRLGPGSIATMIVLGHGAASSGKALTFTAGLAAFVLLLAASLLSASFIGHYLPPRVTAIAQRLMGMILAAFAVDVRMTSLRACLPGPT